MYEKIIEKFKETDSVQQTAGELGVDKIKVRRTLLTEGLWSSPTSERIKELRDKGMTRKEIADFLCVGVKAIDSLSPYNRGEYKKEDRTKEAVRSKEYRARMRIADENQVGHAITTERKPDMDIVKKNKNVLKLRLELNLEWADMDVLKKYGKVKEGIIREVLVPSDMTLHALHYAIQKAFGWQNSHLHSFRIDRDLFEQLTENDFMKWTELCGVYFRFPDDSNDEFWDEDYEEGRSFKNWLKKKYTGPYYYGGENEKPEVTRAWIEEFIAENRTWRVARSFSDWLRNKDAPDEYVNITDAKLSQVEPAFEKSFDELLERLSLEEILPLSHMLYYSYDYGDGWEVQIEIIEEADNGELTEKVKEGYAPLCTAIDGLPVMDDAGGVNGYCNYLLGIHGMENNGPYEDPEESREWGKMIGWTGRMSKPEKLF